MKPTPAELRVRAAVRPAVVRFDFIFEGIKEKIRQGHSRGLKDDCWNALPLLREYKRALRKFCRVRDCRKTPKKKAEGKEAIDFTFSVIDIVILGCAVGKSPKQIQKILSRRNLEEILAPSERRRRDTVH